MKENENSLFIGTNKHSEPGTFLLCKVNKERTEHAPGSNDIGETIFIGDQSAGARLFGWALTSFALRSSDVILLFAGDETVVFPSGEKFQG